MLILTPRSHQYYTISTVYTTLKYGLPTHQSTLPVHLCAQDGLLIHQLQQIFCPEKGDVYKTWYQHCMEIPDNVIDEDSEGVLLVWPHVLILYSSLLPQQYDLTIFMYISGSNWRLNSHYRTGTGYRVQLDNFLHVYVVYSLHEILTPLVVQQTQFLVIFQQNIQMFCFGSSPQFIVIQLLVICFTVFCVLCVYVVLLHCENMCSAQHSISIQSSRGQYLHVFQPDSGFKHTPGKWILSP